MTTHANPMMLAETVSGHHMLRTWLVNRNSEVWLQLEDERLQTRVELPLTDAAIAGVMRRYARPVEPHLEGEIAALPPQVELRDGSVLCSFRFRPRYDVIAKDYVVWRVPGQASQAELATTIAAALTHLARVFQPQWRQGRS